MVGDGYQQKDEMMDKETFLVLGDRKLYEEDG
jgi:hypothetical protein